jgi:hypothetical protein
MIAVGECSDSPVNDEAVCGIKEVLVEVKYA